VGSNIEIHTRRDEVMRVVPRDNELLNETWLSDRDRFSYLGLAHEQRATTPMIKKNGQWQNVDWQTALNTAIDGIKSVVEQKGVEQVAGLAAATSSLEESYLFQKLLRGLGVENIDHRLRQQDFSDQFVNYDQDMALSDIEQSDAVLLVGCHLRAEQPILAHRLRQAAMTGTKVNEINFFASDLLMPVCTQLSTNIEQMLAHLSGVAKALMSLANDEDSAWSDLLAGVVPMAADQTIAMQLSNADKAMVMIGALAHNHPQAAKIRALSALISRLTSSQLVVLPTANSKASALAGVLPQSDVALNVEQSFQANLSSYVLLGVEPELDCANPSAAMAALDNADFVVSLQSYVTETMLTYADVVLPISSFAESSGTFVSIDGQWQAYAGAVSPMGESRPAWKVLRVLANVAELDGFDYISSQDISDEVRGGVNAKVKTAAATYCPDTLDAALTGIQVISEVPMYQTDSVVRRSSALAQTVENQAALIAKMNMMEAENQGLSKANSVMVSEGGQSVTMAFEIDDAIADGCVHMPTGVPEMAHFSAAFSTVLVQDNKQGGES
jgi:NADH-quinone oxidoreductase subunit G